MADNRRVFVGMIPTNNLGEPELMKMFSFYGPVKKIFIMKGTGGRSIAGWSLSYLTPFVY